MTQDEFELIAHTFGVEHPFELCKRYGLTRDELLAHMKVHNNRVFEEWVADYAKRIGRPVNEVRAEVMHQRQLTAQHCNEVYRREVGITRSKEDEMAKKNDAQTTIENINEQEDTTMTENTAANANANEKENIMSIEGIPMKARKNGVTYYDRNTDVERHIAIRKATKFGRIKGIEVVGCIPVLTSANISKDAAEIELLGKACAKFGWKNGVCTQAKAKNYHGTPNPEYKGHGWFVKFAGAKDETSGTVAYPMEAFVWDTESGLPEFDEKKKAQDDARKAKSRFNAAQRALKEANAAAGIKTPRRKTSRKPKTETIAAAPVPMAAPAKLIHIKLANGIEFDARDAKEAAELKALFE